MKILFSALHFGFFRNFESVTVELAQRGHQVLLLADEVEGFGGRMLADDLAARFPDRIRVQYAVSYQDEPWFALARKLRQGADYLRFLEPRYASYPKLSQRAAERSPAVIRRASSLPLLSSVGGRRWLRRRLDAIDAALPRHAGFDAFLSSERPDVALFASVTNPRSPQLDHLRSARALGIPTGVCVYSWDHLSSKALIRVRPDRVFVWNDVQKTEAVELHGLPPDRIVVTGAQVYDQWFTRQPSRDRKTFCEALGLPVERPLFLYVCSAMTPDPGEARFVRQWVQAIRTSADAGVREAAILIRPHPERRKEWDGADWSSLGPVVVAGAAPLTEQAKADYFDALWHSTLVVGLVTSAFLEAAIVGRPVLTILPDELTQHQEGMQHFRYLLEVEDGLLTVARTLPDHVKQIDAIVSGDRTHEERQRRFLKAFVRPFGLDVPATPRFVEAVETLGRLPVQPQRQTNPVWARLAARGLVVAGASGALAPFLRDSRETAERRGRDAAVEQHQHAHRLKWRGHRRRKLVMRVQWKLKRIRDFVGFTRSGRQGQ